MRCAFLTITNGARPQIEFITQIIYNMWSARLAEKRGPRGREENVHVDKARSAFANKR